MSEKSNKEKTISNTYIELYKNEQNGDFDRAIKTSNRLLNLVPQDKTALHCKAVSLIQLSRFEEALSLIEKNSIISDLYFEKAYCHYRLNQPQKAFTILEQAEDDYRIKELKAQVLYRLEQFSDAVQVYQDIIKNADDEYGDEREANLGAVLVMCEDNNSNGINLREDTYELCYNKACYFISRGQFAEAEKKLRQCEKLCRESFEEDGATEEEIESELALIKVQLGFVYQRQGRIREAQQSYISVLKLKLDDVALTAVASNNAVVINKDQNVFDSKKKMKAATNESLVHKLPSFQRKHIALNNAIFNFYTNQYEQCAKLCAALEKNWPDLVIYSKVLSALILAHNEKTKHAIELLETYPVTSEEDFTYLQLCSVHLLLTQGEREAACEKLEKFNEDKYKAGIVGALITLYQGLGKEDEARKVFERTVCWFRKNKSTEGDLSNLWRQAADFHLRSGHPEVAANSLEELLKTNPKDQKTLAQLILAYAQFDALKAIKLGKQLLSLEELSKGVDMESLISSSWLTVKKTLNVKTESSPGGLGSDSKIERKKKHKKHKGKLPKNYDPSATPDPERWLPKYERSGYRKKRDKRAKDVIKGSQGTASGQADQYDFSKVVEQESNDSPSNAEPSPMARNQQRKGQQKKKNKKR